LPFNLRPTTRECVHLVTYGHFRSRDKDGGHTIGSAISQIPMLHANLMAPSFIELELWASKVVHCGNRHFLPFCCCDLDLDPMTFTYTLDPYSLEIHQLCKYELPTSRLLKVIVWQTDRHDQNYIPRRFLVVNNLYSFYLNYY